MGDLTANFSRSEFACKCGCGFDTVDIQTVSALQFCVDSYKKTSGGRAVSMTINCGCRCKQHNDDLRNLFNSTGGKQGENTAPNSQHIYGRAADVVLIVDQVQVEPKEVSAFFATNFPKYSIGTYSTFTHVDSRSNGPARWTL